MKKLVITRKTGEKFDILLDDEDFDRVKQYKWFFHDDRGYIHGQIAKGKNVYLHRFIMNPPKNMQIDHIDHNPLNNQKSNLRICTRSQNGAWARFNKNSTNYRGVTKTPKGWRAEICKNKKKLHIGSFITPEEAALAYNKKALEFFGQFAKLNEITVFKS